MNDEIKSMALKSLMSKMRKHKMGKDINDDGKLESPSIEIHINTKSKMNKETPALEETDLTKKLSKIRKK